MVCYGDSFTYIFLWSVQYANSSQFFTCLLKYKSLYCMQEILFALFAIYVTLHVRLFYELLIIHLLKYNLELVSFVLLTMYL
jgi:hypothetical protein